jgi:hypothetical protein
MLPDCPGGLFMRPIPDQKSSPRTFRNDLRRPKPPFPIILLPVIQVRNKNLSDDFPKGKMSPDDEKEPDTMDGCWNGRIDRPWRMVVFATCSRPGHGFFVEPKIVGDGRDA